MGSGKGSPQTGQTATTSNVNQSNLPAYAEPYFRSLMDRAQQTSNDAYVPYQGDRIAPFSQDQNSAFDQVRNNQGNYQPFFNQAQQGFQQAGSFDPTQVTNGYNAQTLNVGNWTDPNVASSYMSPYQQNVTDINKREALRDYGIQAQQRNSQAQSAGAFGGYRQGIVEAEANRNLNQQLQDIQNTGQQNAYQTGLGAFNQDRSAQLGANQLNQGYLQQMGQMNMAAQGANNQYGLQNAQLQASTAQGLAGLGQATQQAGLTDAQSLINTGAMQQAQQQTGLDTAYQDFINQRDYQRQNLNWLSGILRGVPVSANTSTTGYQAPPSTLSQITGLGLGAAGLSKLVG